jgi:hypothetical protein
VRPAWALPHLPVTPSPPWLVLPLSLLLFAGVLLLKIKVRTAQRSPIGSKNLDLRQLQFQSPGYAPTPWHNLRADIGRGQALSQAKVDGSEMTFRFAWQPIAFEKGRNYTIVNRFVYEIGWA